MHFDLFPDLATHDSESESRSSGRLLRMFITQCGSYDILCCAPAASYVGPCRFVVYNHICGFRTTVVIIMLTMYGFVQRDRCVQRLQCQHVGFVVSKLWRMVAVPRVVNSELGCAVAASDIIANSAVAVIQSLQRRGQVATSGLTTADLVLDQSSLLLVMWFGHHCMHYARLELKDGKRLSITSFQTVRFGVFSCVSGMSVPRVCSVLVLCICFSVVLFV